jgi:hypothetical protein
VWISRMLRIYIFILKLSIRDAFIIRLFLPCSFFIGPFYRNPGNNNPYLNNHSAPSAAPSPSPH